jgi:hypothetical protein
VSITPLPEPFSIREREDVPDLVQICSQRPVLSQAVQTIFYKILIDRVWHIGNNEDGVPLNPMDVGRNINEFGKDHCPCLRKGDGGNVCDEARDSLASPYPSVQRFGGGNRLVPGDVKVFPI